jgi:hypothetical protein
MPGNVGAFHNKRHIGKPGAKDFCCTWKRHAENNNLRGL